MNRLSCIELMHAGKASWSSPHECLDKVDDSAIISPEGFNLKGHTQPSTWKRPIIILESRDHGDQHLLTNASARVRSTADKSKHLYKRLGYIDSELGRLLMFLHLEQLFQSPLRLAAPP